LGAVPRPALAALLAAVLLAPLGAEELDVRALPTSVPLWHWQGATQSLLSGGALLFVAGKGRVTALDPRDGEVAWSTVIGTESEDCGCGHGAHVQVEDRLFVPIADAVAVLDTDDGTLIARASLGGTVNDVRGPPVVAQGRGDGVTTLVRFDERSGAEIARLELAGAHSLERFGERFTLVVETADPVGAGDRGSGAGSGAGAAGKGERTVVLGLDDGLQVVWRRELEGRSYVERDGERLLVTTLDGQQRRRPLDPAAGELGDVLDEEDREAPSSRRLSCGDGTDAAPVQLDLDADGDYQELARVTRPRDPRWSSEVPGWPQECVRWGERLLLRLDRGGSRDLLAVLRARSGAVENMLYLPRDVRALLVAGGRLILETSSGLVGIDPLQAGPPEAETTSLAEAVAAALAEAESRSAPVVARDLQSLGPEALPLAVAVLPQLDGEALEAVAQVAAVARYEPAAAPLAAALLRVAGSGGPGAGAPGAGLAPSGSGGDLGSRETDGAREAMRAREREEHLVRALAVLAGPPQVPLLARYANVEWPQACPAALAALGRIATPPAIAAAEHALREALPAPTPWFVPPRPPAAPMTLAAAREAWETGAQDDPEVWSALFAAARSSSVTVGGRHLLVFPAEDYGSQGDLWVAEPVADPVADPAPASAGGGTGVGAGTGGVFYLGNAGGCAVVRARAQQGVLAVDCRAPSFSAALAQIAGGDREEVDPAEVADLTGDEEGGPPPRALRVALGAWRLDADGDGLTDLLERRLRLDPTRADTDGDGLRDGEDPAPDARPRSLAQREDDALLLAAFASLWACLEVDDTFGASRALYVVGGGELEWRGRPGVTLSAAPADVELLAGPTWHSLPLLALEVEGASSTAAADRSLPLAPGERSVRVGFGGPRSEGAQRHEGEQRMVLRRLDGRWLVTSPPSWAAFEIDSW
jgi:hypothetical protein